MTGAKITRRGDFFVAAGLLGLALLLGGGSAFAPLQRMIVEMAGVVALAWFVVRGWSAPIGGSGKTALMIIAVVVVLIVLQTIPLPPPVWRALPGRMIAADVLDVIGAHDAWLPLSLDPAATREAGYFIIPSIAMFVATLHLDRDAQLKLMMMIVVAAIVSALFVMLQAQGAMWLTLYDAPHATKGKGIFANKNHNAVFLVLAIPLSVMLSREAIRFHEVATQRVTTGIVAAVLAIAVLGCLSRAGIALLPVGLLACIPLLGGRALIRRHKRTALAAMLLLLVATALVSQSSIVKETLDRFGASQEGRYVFWPDVVTAIRTFMPWGSGLGTFVPVFRMNETLDAVHETYTNHAHSDFMEIALEAGVPGLLLVAAFLGWFGWTAWCRLRQGAREAGFAPIFASATGILLLLAASILDYPLRTLLLSCVFAVFAAVIASPEPFAKRRPDA